MLGCQIIDDQSIDVPAAAEPLGRKLVFAAKVVRESFERRLADAGGSIGIWIVLSALADEGFVSQSALASRAHVDGATITHHVDRAEARGLVSRRVDPADRRVRRLELTPEGRRLHRRLAEVAREVDTAFFAGLGDEERAALRRALDQVRANVEQGDA